MGADVLGGLELGLRAVEELAELAAAALPGAGDVGLDGEGQLRAVPVVTDVGRDLTVTGDDVVRRLHAEADHARSAQRALCHVASLLVSLAMSAPLPRGPLVT
ncbi:hypothetical protein VN1338_09250 [Helicobacter pylori]